MFDLPKHVNTSTTAISDTILYWFPWKQPLFMLGLLLMDTLYDVMLFEKAANQNDLEDVDSNRRVGANLFSLVFYIPALKKGY